MDYRTLQITLRYAKDLNKVNLITKMHVYAAVSISGGDKNSKQKTKTAVDHDGDAYPTWDFPMKFRVEEAAVQQNRLMLDFKLICQRTLGDKQIGEVHVPIKELLDSPGIGGQKFVSYQVRKPSGKPKGQLTFSYQFGEINNSSAAPPPPPPPLLKVYEEPVTLYPVVEPSSVYLPTALGGYSPPPSYHLTTAEGGGGHYPPSPGYYPPADCPPPGGYPPSPGYVFPTPPPGYLFPPPSPPPCYGYQPQPGSVYPPPPLLQAPNKNLGWDWRMDCWAV